MSDEIKKCEECGETDKAYYNEKHKRILCRRHYYQMSRHGKIQPDRNIEKKCDECGETEGGVHKNKRFGKVLCRRHYLQMFLHGKIIPDIKPKKACEVCKKTDGKIYGDNRFKMKLCDRHYQQMNQYGKILERTMFDKNDIIEDGQVSYIVLRNNKQEEVARAIIDTDDVEKILQYKWAYNSRKGYVHTNYKGRVVGLHRVIMNYTGKLEIDHINRTPLDNRRENLRIVTRQENSMNKGIQANNKSGIIGVHYREASNPWVVTVSIDKKKLFKYFKTKEEAIRERLLLEKEHYGNNAKQAHLFKEYNIA